MRAKSGTVSRAGSRLADLEASYHAVGVATWATPDFKRRNLASSRKVFEPCSLRRRKPRPRKLEVYALVSGIPFPDEFTGQLADVQAALSVILQDRLHYWVQPSNMGVECLVFKWPEDSLPTGGIVAIKEALCAVHARAFVFQIRGIQVHPDGCVVAKGFDRPGSLFRVRRQLKERLPGLPARQSNWAHVPLGRILEPLGPERFAQLRAFMDRHQRAPIASCAIRTMNLVHETRWYMERRETLAELRLA